MPKITLLVERSDQPGQMTLSERVVAAHLNDEHYAAQLLERLTWAAADAEALESEAAAAEAEAIVRSPAALTQAPARARTSRPDATRPQIR